MHVKVSRDTRRSRTLAMNVAIENAHCDNGYKFMQGLGLVEDVWKS